jgi:hypothetical protein
LEPIKKVGGSPLGPSSQRSPNHSWAILEAGQLTSVFGDDIPVIELGFRLVPSLDPPQLHATLSFFHVRNDVVNSCVNDNGGSFVITVKNFGS